jgi:hypothetical protein
MKTEELISKIVQMSKGQVVEYEEIKFKGVSLLITKPKLKPLIDITWERTHDLEVERLAKEMGITLRKFRQVTTTTIPAEHFFN